jgi:hypothetical protein
MTKKQRDLLERMEWDGPQAVDMRRVWQRELWEFGWIDRVAGRRFRITSGGLAAIRGA